MKELSLEQKAKRYDEAIERAKSKIKSDKDHVLYEDDVIEIFPELKENRVEKPNGGIVLEDLNEGDGFYKVNLAYLSKEQVEEIESLVKKWNPESEDERIRKELIKLLRNLFNNYSYFIKDPFYTECIAWLEKQREQKTADEPRLKVEEGKWYVCISQFCNCIEGRVYKATSDNRIIDDFGTEYDMHNDAYKYFHLWTIKDAKDGDVLRLGDVIAIFKKYIGQEECICYCSFCDNCYCSSCVNVGFEIPIENGEDNVYGCTNTTPATKEQRDLLFQKMKESGYEWDAVKKQLKEIEK